MLSFAPMPDSAGAPQFEKAEYLGTSADRCAFCKQPVGQMYYRINTAMACGSCADRAQREIPQDTHAAFSRAVLFGMGAAFIGFILYAVFGIMTGWMIGYVSLAVGYLLGKAMMKGSRGIGGRRYQVTAAILTYAAVSMSAIPIAISQFREDRKSHQQVQQQQVAPNAEQPETAPRPKPSLGAALAYLAFLGLASPFLELQDPLHGIIGLFILFIGVQIAWKITAGRPAISVEGPYENSQPRLA
jgi:hypothetical protein